MCGGTKREMGSELFWGDDASAMSAAYRDNPTEFEAAEYRRIAQLPRGIERSR